ncbi:MAG TPA: YsnF/AvaK domain-containing protein [Flavisolibacter sp.]|jgi:stress response protein YsnF|nr:YsnF/AvaK domain-containing protein [Flavisolibacter sp.]
MAQTVIGFFDDQQEAQQAVAKLQSSGITRDRIDVSRGGSSSSTSMSGTGSVNPVSGSDRDDNSIRRTTDDRTVDREGRNTNAFTDFFNNLFGGSDDNDDADRYSRVATNSNAIVTVHAQSREEAERAADILDECGAVDVDERSAQYGATAGGRVESTGNRRETTIPRVEENLEVGKRTEERGGVRVRSRIVERPVEEHVRLREEHVNVERQPVDRPVSMDDARNFQEREIELTERTEVPVVNKEARVVEEVRVSKDVTERDETIRDTVRNTEVDVDRLDAGSTRSSDDLRNSDLDENTPRDRGGLL